MKQYSVKIPYTGYVEVHVLGENEKQALEKAFEIASFEHTVEWELHKQICQGNVFKGLLNEFDIIEEKSEEDGRTTR